MWNGLNYSNSISMEYSQFSSHLLTSQIWFVGNKSELLALSCSYGYVASMDPFSLPWSHLTTQCWWMIGWRQNGKVMIWRKKPTSLECADSWSCTSLRPVSVGGWQRYSVDWQGTDHLIGFLNLLNVFISYDKCQLNSDSELIISLDIRQCRFLPFR